MDRLERLMTENKELRETLQSMIYEATYLSPREDDGSHWCRIYRTTLEKARALEQELAKSDLIELLERGAPVTNEEVLLALGAKPVNGVPGCYCIEATTNVDDALRLMPEGWFLHNAEQVIDVKGVLGDFRVYISNQRTWGKKGPMDSAKGVAPTLPRAICAALLRAKGDSNE